SSWPWHMSFALAMVFLSQWVVVCCCAAQTAGQQFKELRTAPTFDRRQAGEIRRSLSSGNIADRELFVQYYTSRVEEFTHEDKRDKVSDLRFALKKIDLKGASGQAHRE